MVWARFLHEDPWKRLDLLRQKVPNIPFQVGRSSAFLLNRSNNAKTPIVWRAFWIVYCCPPVLSRRPQRLHAMMYTRQREAASWDQGAVCRCCCAE